MSSGSRPPRPGRESNGKEKQRSRTGCATCRARKVRCDETPGGCKNCERLDLVCPNAPPSSLAAAAVNGRHEGAPADGTGLGGSRSQGSLRRPRTYRSCKACRLAKARCSGQRHGCLRCRSRGLECSYDGKELPDWIEAVSSTHTPAPPQSNTSTSAQPPLVFSSATSLHNSFAPRPSIFDDDEASDSSDSTPGVGSFACDLSWLLSLDLPDAEDKVIALVEEYFLNIHSLRCLGFIHKPTLMQQLADRVRSGLSDDGLINAICALGAKFLALKHASADMLGDGFARTAGNQWAKKSQFLLFANLNRVSVEKLMTAVLLHEHELQAGNYASAFMLTGLSVRMAQALQINLETPAENSLVETAAGLGNRAGLSSRESRRRLAWAVWAMDACYSSEVQGRPLLEDSEMQIQLPCNERSFLFQMSCVVETLLDGTHVDTAFIPPQVPREELSLQAQFIRLSSLRKQVLNYISHLDRAPTSSQTGYDIVLESALTRWHAGLPLRLLFNQDSAFAHKESLQLGGLVLLHVTYHQALCELGRIAMPEISKPGGTHRISTDHGEVESRLQTLCFENAVAIASIFEEALHYGPEALADAWLCVAAHDSSNIITHYIASRMGHSPDGRAVRQRAITALRSTLGVLQRMVPIHSLARELHESAKSMVDKSGLSVSVDNNNSGVAHPAPGPEAPVTSLPTTPPPTDSTPNPLSLYGLVRRDVHDAANQAPQGNFTTSAYSFASQGRRGTLPGERIFQVLQLTSNVENEDSSGVTNNGFDDLPPYLPLMLGNFSMPP